MAFIWKWAVRFDGQIMADDRSKIFRMVQKVFGLGFSNNQKSIEALHYFIDVYKVISMLGYHCI